MPRADEPDAEPLGEALAAAEHALAARLGLSPRGNRAQRRNHRGLSPGSGKHPIGATKPLLSERKAKRRRRR